MSKKSYAAGFSSNYANDGRQQSLAEKHKLNERVRERKVLNLQSRSDDFSGRGRDRKPIQIAVFSMDLGLRAESTHEAFYEEVYKILHAEKADVIRVYVKDRTHCYPRAWIERMYKKYVLGEGAEPASPEVEELVAETATEES
jgi:hypothetical protein